MKKIKNLRLYRFIKKFQKILWLLGIAWHDKIYNECTPDFNCCVKTIGKRSWLRFKQ